MKAKRIPTVAIKSPADQNKKLIINEKDYNPSTQELWNAPARKAEPEQEPKQEPEGTTIPAKIIEQAARLGVDADLLMLGKEDLMALCEKQFDVSLDKRKKAVTMAQDITLLRQKKAEHDARLAAEAEEEAVD